MTKLISELPISAKIGTIIGFVATIGSAVFYLATHFMLVKANTEGVADCKKQIANCEQVKTKTLLLESKIETLSEDSKETKEDVKWIKNYLMQSK